MSESAPERPARKGGNPLTRKIGPLPAWGWVAGAAVIAGGYMWWRNRQGAAAATSGSATTSTSATDTTGTGTDQAASIATLQSEIQALQGEMSQDTGQDTGQGSQGGGGGGKRKPKYLRHVSTGKESLNQIARASGTSIADLIRLAGKAPESDKNVAELTAWAKHPGQRRKGVVYYTANP